MPGNLPHLNVLERSAVSLGLLCDSRTQEWGTTRFISNEIKEQGMRRKNRKKKDMCLLRQYNGLNL
jgi:hypothetical protein